MQLWTIICVTQGTAQVHVIYIISTSMLGCQPLTGTGALQTQQRLFGPILRIL